MFKGVKGYNKFDNFGMLLEEYNTNSPTSKLCQQSPKSLCFYNFTKEGVIDDEGKIPFPFLCFLLVVLFHPLLSFPPTRGLFVLVAGLLMNAYHDVIRLTVTKLVLIAVFYLG